MKRTEVTAYLDKFLGHADFKDYSQNGLQVEGPEEVKTVAFAVDARQASIDGAIVAGAQLLVVHHGLYWGKPLTATGLHFRRLHAMIQGCLGLYASHLPLDAHPQCGNNAELVRILGLTDRRPFAAYNGNPAIGFGGRYAKPVPLRQVIDRLVRATGATPCRVLACGPASARKVACVSGGAGDMLAAARDAGFDTFVTGEGPHHVTFEAEERGINVVFGGHYATETLGVKALAAQVRMRLKLKTVFLDLPTGA